MKKMTKGALAMVLAGSVTFSIANGLLAEQPLKRLAKEIALPISADREKANAINQAEKKDQTPSTNLKDNEIAVTQGALKNNQPAGKAVQVNTKKLSYKTTTNVTPTPVATTVSVKSTKAPITMTTPTKSSTATKPRTNTTSASTKTATTAKPTTSTNPATTTKPATSTNSATTTKPATSAKPSTSTAAKSNSKAAAAATTKTNHGQQVSQAAKERAASRKAAKENN